MAETMRTIQQRVQAEIVEKKSRFIAQIAPTATEEEALSFIEEVKAQHRMARHNVYAYIVDGGSRIRYTDDGEPAKTAGLPTLQVIQHAGLSDVAIVVTRYFGGILLGTGGLVRAYTQATQAALDAACIVVISRCLDIDLTIPYSLYDQIQHLAETAGVKMVDPLFTDEVSLTLTLLEEQHDEFRIKLQEIMRDQGSIHSGEVYKAAY